MSGASGGGDPGCIFCNAGGDVDPRDAANDLVLIRGRTAYVILNLYPYNNGHLMVVPYRHVATLARLTIEEQAEVMQLTRHGEIALAEAYQPQGLNVGINLGKPAGAGIVDHLHVHMVPRWNGDTNFMTAIAETRVLPEELSATKHRLVPIFERLSRQDA